jgi:polyvinyl alcohol dehydrogenase (cytochrome)
MIAAAGVADGAAGEASAYGWNRGDWPTWQRDTAGSRFNAAEWKINPATVGRLKLKWAYTFNRVPYARVGSQPAVTDGVLYVGAPDGKFVALDAKSGKTKWSYDTLSVTGPLPAGASNFIRDGAAVAGDKVYFGDSTGRVFALYKRTGQLAWANQISTQPTSMMTSSPLVVDDRLYIGVSTLEAGQGKNFNYPCCSHRGKVVSVDANTGKLIWEYYTVPPAQRIGTWPSGAAKFGPAGGNVWASPVADLRTHTIFLGTGNNTSGQAGDIDSMLALDMKTGKPRWKQQLTFPDTYTTACELPDPGEYCAGKGSTAHDWDIGATANVIEVHGRTLVTVGQKKGDFYAFDARTGKIVWKTALGNQGPMISAGVQWGSVYDGRYIYAATWYGHPSSLYALDPADGRIVWETPHPADGCKTGGAAAYPEYCQELFTPAASGTPGLLYEGSADGKMRIYSSRNGTLLWQYDALRDFQGVNGLPGRGSAISGNGGAVIVDGMMYVQAGYYPFYPTDKGTVLLAFSLQ